MINFDETIQRLSHNLWLPRVVSVLLVISIGWWAIAEVLPMFQHHDSPVRESTPIGTMPASETAKPLGDLNLFGEEIRNTEVKAIEAKDTKLNLTLRGILATIDNPIQGYAQIENAKKEERYFTVKDNIFGLATLEEIYIDRVIILHDGKYETLKLPEEFLDNKHFLAAQLKQKQKKIATDYRKLLVNRKGMELIKLFGFDTAYKNGSFIGFVVRALGDKGREMMETLGVEEGDIVVAVNGENLSQSIQAVNNLAKLKHATKVNVEIDRGGTQLFFDFEFDDTDPVEVLDEDDDPGITESSPDVTSKQ